MSATPPKATAGGANAARQAASPSGTDMAFVRRRATQVFGDKPVGPNALAANIAFGAAVLGAKHVELTSDGVWQFIASDFDWLRAPDGRDASAARLFERFTPFPQQSPGSHRSEIYVAAFARRAYVAHDGELSWVLGGELEGQGAGNKGVSGHGEQPAGGLPHVGHVPPWCIHVLAFSFA